MSDLNEKFAQNGVDFAFNVFDKLAAANELKENFVFSPTSIQCCLASVFAGSSGETAQQLVDGLKLVSNEPEKVASAFENVMDNFKKCDLLSLANKVYIKRESRLQENYAQTIKEKYKAEAEPLDFSNSVEAAKVINGWVSQCTKGNITKLITPEKIPPATALLLINALHFKGQWEQKLEEQKYGEDNSFWYDPENCVELPFMRKTAKYPYAYFPHLNCAALQLPYKDADLSMLILLPDERDGLKKLAQTLKTVNLLEITKNMNSKEVVVALPKFKIEYSIELKETLKQLGIKKIFQSDAQFNNMVEDSDNISVSQVVHKATIEVDAEGAESAGITGS